jgi:hypothetical protein
LSDRVSNAGTAEAAFTIATALPPPPTFPMPEFQARLDKVSGDGQTGLSGRAFGEPIVWQIVDATTGQPVKGAMTQYSWVNGCGYFVPAMGLSATTDSEGKAGCRIVAGPGAGRMSIRVEAPPLFRIEPVQFDLETRSPCLDLVEKKPGSECATISGNAGAGRVALNRPPFDPYGWGAYPGEAYQQLMGVRLTDASGNPIQGAEVRPCLLGFDGSLRESKGLVEFMPASARTDLSGCAFIAVWVCDGVFPDLLRVRFELPEFAAGGSTPSHLGVDWTLPVVSPNDSTGSSRRASWLVSGQGQIAMPGRVLAADLGFRTRYYVSLQTTQPGDSLELISGVLQNSWVDPNTKLQTLQFSSVQQDSVSFVRVHLGSSPLPRLIGACGGATTTCIAVGPPEVRFVDAATFTPVEVIPNQLVDRLLAVPESLPAVMAEMRVPKGYVPSQPGAMGATLASLEHDGELQLADAYWPPVLQDVFCTQVTGDDRFDLYRSRPVVSTQYVFMDGVPTGLPSTRIYQRMRGRLRLRPEDAMLCQVAEPAPAPAWDLVSKPKILTKDDNANFHYLYGKCPEKAERYDARRAFIHSGRVFCRSFPVGFKPKCEECGSRIGPPAWRDDGTFRCAEPVELVVA